MAKKPQPEFTVPPESITQGGSYIVDPAAGTVARVAHTQPAAPTLSVTPPAPEEAPAVSPTQPAE